MDLTSILEACGLTPAAAALTVAALAILLPWLAAILPPTVPGRRLLDLLAANVGHARNAVGPQPPKVPPAAALLLAMGLSLSACAMTADRQARVADIARGADAALHAAAVLYLAQPDLPPARRAAIEAADAALTAAVQAWAEAPADDARAQAVRSAMAALVALLPAAATLAQAAQQ